MGLLDRLRGRAGPKRTSRSKALAMVMMRRSDSFDPMRVRRELETLAPPLGPVQGWETAGETPTATMATTASVPGGSLGLVVIPAPIPAGDLDGPTRLAWHWPAAAAEIAQHRAHVVVFVDSTRLSAVEAHLLLTSAAGAVLASSEAVGVYVGNALLVRSAADYAEDAARASPDRLPILSWIGFQLVREDREISAYTTGLREFGIRELEIVRSGRAASELLGTLADLANYQLSTGQEIGDGHTFGESAQDRTRVRFAASRFIPDTEVAVLELG